jgi:hypothetical protein
MIVVAAACSDGAPITAERLIPDYRGVETRLLQNDLVRFEVAMTNALSIRDVEDYAQCAAAGYTLIRGYAFAQHVRTQVTEADGLWTGDSVYTISAKLPQGIRKIDAEVVAAACKDRGIPTV